MRLLAIDTETTGMPRRGEPDEAQPHIVQVAAMLVESDGWRMLSEMQFALLLPSGVEIDPGAERVHGISIRTCRRYGISPRTAMQAVLQCALASDLIVGFNVEFDVNLLAVTCRRYGLVHEPLTKRPSLCVMQLAADRCPAFGGRWPKLEDAHRSLCGRPHPGAHSAIGDVRATLNVLKKLTEQSGDRSTVVLSDWSTTPTDEALARRVAR